MVNFYVDGWNGDIKAVYSGDSEADVIATGINLHAMGLERYNILADRYFDIENRQDMLDAMMAVKYTKSYESSTTPYWYSEFTQEDGENRFGELTILNTAEDFRPIVEYIQNEYQHRQRDKKTWYTAHTSIYDLETKSLMVCVEELYDKSYKDKLISALNTNNNVQISVSGSTLIITIED